MKFALWYLALSVMIGVVAVAAYRYLGSVAAFVVVIVPLAFIANGWLAEWEDEQPGGFNNPLPPTETAKRTDEINP